MAESGFIRIVKGSWNKAFYNELESFIGDGKTKDDQVDATSDAFITLAETKYIPSFTPYIATQTNPFSRN